MADPLLDYADRHEDGLSGFVRDLEATAGLDVVAQWGVDGGRWLPATLSRHPHAQVLEARAAQELNRERVALGLKGEHRATLYLRVTFGHRLKGVSGNRMVPVHRIRATGPGQDILDRLKACEGEL